MPLCNICGRNDSHILVRKDGFDVYRCQHCGLAFTYPQPQCLADQYNESYFSLYGKRQNFRLRRAVCRLSAIELFLSPGRLLDIGCSLGYFIEAAKSRGWAAEGLELSPYASQAARDSGLNVRTGDLESAGYEKSGYDCVTMWDVFEHVPDPAKHLKEINRILVPGGLVVIGTPNLAHSMFKIKQLRWRHLKPAEHIFYFNEANLNLLLEKTGFNPVKPAVSGKRSYPGSITTRIREKLCHFFNLNDVITIYGVKK